jgi:RNA polymerase-binding transcription factor DksA
MKTAVSVDKVVFVDGIRDRLRRRRGELAERQQRVKRDLARANEPLVADFADRAIQMQNDEALEVIGEAARDELVRVNAALERIDAGRYGLCEECGEAIEQARLEAVPYAITCALCARE